MSSKKSPMSDYAKELFCDDHIPIPLSQPIDKEALITDITQLYPKYVVMSEHQALLASLWAINSWGVYKYFDVCPILLINAPEKACGKTQLLNLTKKIVRRPLDSGNLTQAILFRMIHKYDPTFMIDEADTFMGGKGEMAGIFNKGCERGGRVMRMEVVGKELIERCYHVYGPKALAGIALERHLNPATISRCLHIAMKRKTKDDKVERLRSIDPKFIADLRSRIHRFVQDHREEFSNGCVELPEELDDREQDYAEPLLMIAKCFGEKWYRKAVDAFIALSEETAPPKSASNQLLEDVREILQAYNKRYIPTVDLLTMLNQDPNMDWCRYNHGQALTARQLSKYLSAYGIKPKTVRMSNDYTPKGYEVREFEEAFGRYLEDISVESAEEAEEEGDGVDMEKFQEARKAELEEIRKKIADDKKIHGPGYPPSPNF